MPMVATSRDPETTETSHFATVVIKCILHHYSKWLVSDWFLPLQSPQQKYEYFFFYNVTNLCLPYCNLVCVLSQRKINYVLYLSMFCAKTYILYEELWCHKG